MQTYKELKIWTVYKVLQSNFTGLQLNLNVQIYMYYVYTLLFTVTKNVRKVYSSG